MDTFDSGKMVNFKTYLKPDPTYYFGCDIMGELPTLLKSFVFDRVFFVTNPLLLDLYGKEILDLFEANGIVHEALTIKDSENDKTFSNLEYLCEELVARGITKGSIVIGFGGGCLTNIVGLASGMIYRGIRYVEMPTTFMGITDSTLSNKQAVNGKQGKNQYGMYYAPIFIFGDTKYLRTESLVGRKSAIAEGIKNALINEVELLDFYETCLDKDLENLDLPSITELAYRVIQSKLKILAADPSEKGFGMALEYGHTFGHAMEFFSDGQIPHGIAVAKGMCIAAELSHELGYLSREEVDKHYYYFGKKLGLDLTIPEYISVDNIMSTILADNKKTVKGVKYVMLEKLGKCLNPDGDWQVSVDPETVRRILTAYKKKHQPAALTDSWDHGNMVTFATMVFKCFAQGDVSLSALELANRLDTNQATMGRVLTNLNKNGFLEQDPKTRAYRFGPAMVEMARAVYRTLDGTVTAVAASLANALRTKVGERIHLEVVSGNNFYLSYVADTPEPIGLKIEIGDKVMPHAHAGAKAMLAFSQPDVVDYWLGQELMAYTPNTVTDPDRLRKVYEGIRETGVAYDFGEYLEEVNAIGAPVFDHRNEPVAAILVVVPAYRMKEKAWNPDSIAALKDTANAISTQLHSTRRI
nr:IclR family transcriptional regulator C-terminal domain-containing protein [uncultured Holophaga sp.]